MFLKQKQNLSLSPIYLASSICARKRSHGIEAVLATLKYTGIYLLKKSALLSAQTKITENFVVVRVISSRVYYFFAFWIKRRAPLAARVKRSPGRMSGTPDR